MRSASTYSKYFLFILFCQQNKPLSEVGYAILHLVNGEETEAWPVKAAYWLRGSQWFHWEWVTEFPFPVLYLSTRYVV